MLSLGILGTGIVGNTLGAKLVRSGHRVMMGSRSRANDKAAQWVKAAGRGASRLLARHAAHAHGMQHRWKKRNIVDLGDISAARATADGMEIQAQHYAFLVSEREFDEIFGRIKERGLAYWADPGQTQKRRINTHFGGRGVCFEDPSGHLLEIITRPYGSE